MLHLPFLIILRRESEEEEHDDDDDRSGLGTGAIAGIAVGVAVVLVAVVVLFWFKRHRLRRRKIKRRGLEDEEKPLPVDRTIDTSASSDRGPTDMQAENRERHVTPAPAYSSLQNIDSSHNAHTGKGETELDGVTNTINEIGSSGKRAEQDLSDKGGRELELDSLEKSSAHGNAHSGQDLAHEMSVNNSQSSDPTQRYSEMDGRNRGSAEHGRLQSDAISELPGSSVSGTTMLGTVSSMSIAR